VLLVGVAINEFLQDWELSYTTTLGLQLSQVLKSKRCAMMLSEATENAIGITVAGEF